jgi:hypothetical protein
LKAYAPDTVIDNLLLRHEPRFSVYSKFFKAIMQFESELLAHPVAKAIPLNRSNSSSSSRSSMAMDEVVLITTCYQYVDPHQLWSTSPAEHAQAYSSNSINITSITSEKRNSFSISPKSDPKMCLTTASLDPLGLAPCSNTDRKQAWRRQNISGAHASGGYQIARVLSFLVFEKNEP